MKRDREVAKWKRDQAKRDEREKKRKEVRKTLLDELDAMTKRCEVIARDNRKTAAFTAEEIERIDDARHAFATVLGGYVRPIRR